MLLPSKAPLVGIEVSSGSIRGVELQLRGQRFVVVKRDQLELPSGLLTETFTRPNIADGAAFNELLGQLCDRMDIRERRVAIALPDPVARVQILSFEKLPRREDELLDIVSWRLKRDKLLPYDPHEARIAFQIMKTVPATQEGASEGIPVLISAIRKEVLDQYVSLFEEASLEPAAADLASFYGANLFEDEMRKNTAPGDTSALLQLSGKRFSLMVFHGDALAFFRTKGLIVSDAHENTDPKFDSVKREIQSTLSFYNEQTKGRHGVSLMFLPGNQTGALSGVASSSGIKRVFLAPEGNAGLGEGISPDPRGTYSAATGAAMTSFQ